MLTGIRSTWLQHLVSTEPSNRPQAEAALREMYPEMLKAPAPDYFFWFESPQRAGWAVKLLAAAHDRMWNAFVDHKASKREGRLFLESVRAELCEKTGLKWEPLTQIVGLIRTQQAYFNLARLDLHGVEGSLGRLQKGDPKREELLNKTRAVFEGPDKDDELRRIDEHFQSALHDSCDWGYSLTFNPSNNSHYTFTKMAQDQEEAVAGGRAVPPLLANTWELARNAGPCWVFKSGVVLLDRPAELHFNPEMFLHCDDGPAGKFRDGTNIWALNGAPTNEQLVLHPETIEPHLWKELHPDVVARAKARRAAMGMPDPSKPAAARNGKQSAAFASIIDSFGKRSSLFETDVPRAVEERIRALRAHNRGSLPLFDRYLAGEHEAVWKDLVALGAAVRQNPHVADALAVAYETMIRVEANVRTVSNRLTQAGFKPAWGKPHTPPSRTVEKQILKLEKATGTMPLSLRTFYEVVGAVTWMGKGVLPPAAPLCPDPLVVMAIEEAMHLGNELGGKQAKRFEISPDALSKAETGGGDGYHIDAPDQAADAILHCDCSQPYFVDYLRQAFRYGGFPGYAGVEFPPPQLAELSAGLRPF